MTEIRVMMVCAERGLQWDPEFGSGCIETGHDHRRYEVHLHRTTIRLPDGTPITGVSFDPTDPYDRSERPDYGLYLDPRWQPPWHHDHLDWPDLGVPADAAELRATLQSVLDRARNGERVEIGCLGGHGRTGTALAVLAVLTGHPADDAVAWVRTAYCPQAVETPEQEAFVEGLSEH
jgi:hypothetical protein